MLNYLWFFAAALFEIAGCYAFWLWLRMDRSALWIAPGLLALTAFALILTRVEAEFAGRTYAAYGGVYVCSALFWLAFVERTRPLPSDYLGGAVCLLGAAIILFGPRLSHS
ncbi:MULTISPECIES: YnfA family protein [Pseudomonas]|uniref:YnfA family protein n=1 Tax=Pseudomonas TaxID=286 RepID=UPI00257B9C89|nr:MULTISPECIES: YnfA family protein [Pseudomonas]